MSYITLPSTGGGISSVNTDGITLTGDGVATDLEILAVQTDGLTIIGNGTPSQPLEAIGGGGTPAQMAYMFVNRKSILAPPLVVPFLSFPVFDNGEWSEQISSGDWDTAAGSLRCFKEGVYKITGQFTYSLTELVGGNTEFILRAGLVEALDPSLPMYCQGYLHANIESNTEWTATVHFQWLGLVQVGQEFYPFVETVGDSCSLQSVVDFSSTVVVEEVTQITKSGAKK